MGFKKIEPVDATLLTPGASLDVARLLSYDHLFSRGSFLGSRKNFLDFNSRFNYSGIKRCCCDVFSVSPYFFRSFNFSKMITSNVIMNVRAVTDEKLFGVKHLSYVSTLRFCSV